MPYGVKKLFEVDQASAGHLVFGQCSIGIRGEQTHCVYCGVARLEAELLGWYDVKIFTQFAQVVFLSKNFEYFTYIR